MPNSINHDSSRPATLEAVIEAIAKLSALDELEIKALVSSGKLQDILPFLRSPPMETVQDFASDDEVVEASPLPLSIKQRAELILASIPGNNFLQGDAKGDGIPQDLELLLREIRALNSNK